MLISVAECPGISELASEPPRHCPPVGQDFAKLEQPCRSVISGRRALCNKWPAIQKEFQFASESAGATRAAAD